MILTKANFGEQTSCGLILKTRNERVTFTIHRQWLYIPLESVVLNDGQFTIVPINREKNVLDYDASYEPDGYYNLEKSGKGLLLYANRDSMSSDRYEYDSDLITIPQDDCYISPRGIKYNGSTVFAYEPDWVLQCIAAFYGFYFERIENEYQNKVKLIVPPELKLELGQSSGIKTGQFIL